MRFASLLRFVLLDYDRGYYLQTLPKLRKVFTLVIILHLLSTVCVAPVVATADQEDNQSAVSLHEGSLRDGPANDDQQLETHSKNRYTNGDRKLYALKKDSDNDCTPNNGTETDNCTTTRTTASRDCYSNGSSTTDTKTSTDDTGSDDTPTRHTTDSGFTETEPSNTQSTMTEPNTKSSQRSNRTNAPESGLLPDINSPTIALIGILCVIGGLIALTR